MESKKRCNGSMYYYRISYSLFYSFPLRFHKPTKIEAWDKSKIRESVKEEVGKPYEELFDAEGNSIIIDFVRFIK